MPKSQIHEVEDEPVRQTINEIYRQVDRMVIYKVDDALEMRNFLDNDIVIHIIRFKIMERLLNESN
jgi:hypothetical protein